MLNDIFYFIDEKEKNILKDTLKGNDSKTFTILKKLVLSDTFCEKLLVLDETENLIDSFDTNEFSHLVIDRPYLVSKDHF